MEDNYMDDPNKFNILLVEDDRDEFEITKRAIEKSNLSATVSWASSEQETLAHIEQNIAPDFIFLDINMPDITGLNLLKKLKTDPKLNGTACYILSSSDRVEIKIRLHRYKRIERSQLKAELQALQEEMESGHHRF